MRVRELGTADWIINDHSSMSVQRLISGLSGDGSDAHKGGAAFNAAPAERSIRYPSHGFYGARNAGPGTSVHAVSSRQRRPTREHAAAVRHSNLRMQAVAPRVGYFIIIVDILNLLRADT